MKIFIEKLDVVIEPSSAVALAGLISKKELYGYKSQESFTHLTDLEIYQKLTKT